MCSPGERGSVSMEALNAMSCQGFFSSCFPLAIVFSASACSMSSVFPGGQAPSAEQFVKVSTVALSL